MKTAAMTRNQTLVQKCLKKAGKPLSAYTILDELRDEGIKAPLQVYRALEKLREMGLVHKLESLSSYTICQEPGGCKGRHSAFAICASCGNVDEVVSPKLQKRLKKWSDSHDFEMTGSVIEMHGLCSMCKTATAG